MITDINSSKFPSNYDDDNSLTYIKPGETEVSALHMNQLRSSIFAIERALGVNPGAGMTVAQRLSALTRDLSELFSGILRHSLVFAYDKNGYAARAIFGEHCETWIVYDGNKKELADWPDTGRLFTNFQCESDMPEMVPLSIVGRDNGGFRGRRIRMYDSVEITNSLRLSKIQDPGDPAIQYFAGILDAPWGMMTRGSFRNRAFNPPDAPMGGQVAIPTDGACGTLSTDCYTDETSNWPIDCWVDWEIIKIGDPRWVNITGDCMSGDLDMTFHDEEVSNYPSALRFGQCDEPYAFIMTDTWGVRLDGSDNVFEMFVHESTPEPMSSVKPLVIGGSNAANVLGNVVIADRRRLKLIDDVEIAGSARVKSYMYVGNNDQINTKPNFTRDQKSPNFPVVYNGFIINPTSTVFSIPFYDNGYAGAGITYGHRPGHTHMMADILDLEINVVGPEILTIYDTYDTDPAYNPANNVCDHVQGRVVVNQGDLSKNMIVECRYVHYDNASGVYPMLIFRARGGAITYTHNTCCAIVSGDRVQLEFDLSSTVPVGEYDAWIEDTNGLKGYAFYANGGGIDVVDPLLATINHPGPTGSGDLAPGTSYTFSATMSGGKEPYVSYSWNFGDGDTGSGSNPPHTYDAPGSYTVSLTVFDINNFNYTTTRTFNVGATCAITSVSLTWHQEV